MDVGWSERISSTKPVRKYNTHRRIWVYDVLPHSLQFESKLVRDDVFPVVHLPCMQEKAKGREKEKKKKGGNSCLKATGPPSTLYNRRLEIFHDLCSEMACILVNCENRAAGGMQRMQVSAGLPQHTQVLVLEGKREEVMYVLGTNNDIWSIRYEMYIIVGGNKPDAG